MCGRIIGYECVDLLTAWSGCYAQVLGSTVSHQRADVRISCCPVWPANLSHAGRSDIRRDGIPDVAECPGHRRGGRLNPPEVHGYGIYVPGPSITREQRIYPSEGYSQSHGTECGLLRVCQVTEVHESRPAGEVCVDFPCKSGTLRRAYSRR